MLLILYADEENLCNVYAIFQISSLFLAEKSQTLYSYNILKFGPCLSLQINGQKQKNRYIHKYSNSDLLKSIYNEYFGQNK